MKKLSLVLLFVVLLSLSGCSSRFIVADLGPEPTVEVEEDAVVEEVETEEVEVEEVAAEEVEAEPSELNVQNLIILVVLVVIVALGNERITELLKRVGLVKNNYAAVWQTVIGSVVFAALALAQYMGLENQLTQAVDALVEFATAAAVMIPIFAQSAVAKWLHEQWKVIGFSYSLTKAELDQPKMVANNPNQPGG